MQPLTVGRRNADFMIRAHPREKRTNGGDMEAVIRHLGDLKFEAAARGHKVVCDQPPENGGSDAGMTPPEFLLVSLGTCAGYYAAQYLKLHSLPALGLEIN